MKKLLITPVIVICLIACEEKDVQPEDNSTGDTLAFSQPIEVETNRTVTLLPEAQQAVSEWLAYATAQNEVEAMKETTGTEVIQSSEPLVQIMENLYITLPDTLQVTAVRARANVLHTKAQILHQLANKKNKNASEIIRAVNEVITEFDNFKLQLNELFLKTPEDFELELDREFEESQDTVLGVPAAQQ